MAYFCHRGTCTQIQGKPGTKRRILAFVGVWKKLASRGCFPGLRCYIKKGTLECLFEGRGIFEPSCMTKIQALHYYATVWIGVSPKLLEKLPWKLQNSPFYFMCHLRMVDYQIFTKWRMSSDLIINAPGFSLKDAADHPNCPSAKFFLDGLLQFSN